MFIDKVAREANQDFTSGVKLSTGELEVLLFVDDMVVLADSAERLESNLKTMSEVLSRWELKVNWKMTKVTCRPAIIAPISSMYVRHPVYKHRVNAQ